MRRPMAVPVLAVLPMLFVLGCSELPVPTEAARMAASGPALLDAAGDAHAEIGVGGQQECNRRGSGKSECHFHF